MKNKWFAYIKINEDENKILTSGIEFNEFINGINEKPKNVLILDGYPINSNRHFKLGLDYVKNCDLEEFYKEDVYSFGDFSWIDFEEEENLEKVDELLLSKLLYLRHRCKPLDTCFFDNLKNQYAYFG